MLTTEAIITAIDLTATQCQVRVPIFENTSVGSPALIEARIIAQPGFINNYKIGDYVWVTFKNTEFDLALIIGKIYQGLAEEQKTSGGGGQFDSLKVTGDSALIPEVTEINTSQKDYNTILKLINKIKDLEIKNVEYLQEIKDLHAKIDKIAIELGANLVRDVDGNILTDIEGETMQYATDTDSSLKEE